MRRALIVTVIMTAAFAISSLAMLPPEEYEILKEEAPVVVVGKIGIDEIVKDTKDGEVRYFEVKVSEVERGDVKVGATIKVEYFVPVEEPDGPGGIRGATENAVYRLYLQPTDDEGVYEGAAYGSSLQLLKK